MYKGEIEYLSNTLKNYYYLKRKAKEYDQEIILLNNQIEEERIIVKGMSYDNSTGVAGSGCSVNAVRPTSTNPLVNEQMKIIFKRDDTIRKYNALDRDNRITERISKLSVESQIIINNIYRRELSITDVSKLENVSKQAISNRLNKALEEMCNL